MVMLMMVLALGWQVAREVEYLEDDGELVEEKSSYSR